MNWLDILILIYIGYNIMKGYSLGLILSLFNLFQVIISLFITKNYYRLVYSFILESDFLLNIFEKVSYFLLKIIFWRKNRLDPNFLPRLLDTSIMDLILLGFSIFFVYKIAILVIDILYSLFSFLLEIRIFRKLNKYGGMFFGFFTGVLIVFIINEIMRPILLIIPDLMLSRAFLDSAVLGIILNKLEFLREGMFYEKTGYIFRNIISIYRNFISFI